MCRRVSSAARSTLHLLFTNTNTPCKHDRDRAGANAATSGQHKNSIEPYNTLIGTTQRVKLSTLSYKDGTKCCRPRCL